MKLYSSGASPYVRKCRVVAREAGVADRVEEVDTKVVPANPNRDYGSNVNPLRRIPSMVLEDGSVLVDSRTIAEYLAHAGGGAMLFPAAGPARWKALSTAAFAEGILDSAVSTRYETVVRPAELRWDGWVEDHTQRIRDTLDLLEGMAGEIVGGGPGTPIDIGGVVVGVAVGYLDFRFPDLSWREGRPRLAAWYKAVASRPSFRETEPKA